MPSLTCTEAHRQPAQRWSRVAAHLRLIDRDAEGFVWRSISQITRNATSATNEGRPKESFHAAINQ